MAEPLCFLFLMEKLQPSPYLSTSYIINPELFFSEFNNKFFLLYILKVEKDYR
jgi:hypothetical protein